MLSPWRLPTCCRPSHALYVAVEAAAGCTDGVSALRTEPPPLHAPPPSSEARDAPVPLSQPPRAPEERNASTRGRLEAENMMGRWRMVMTGYEGLKTWVMGQCTVECGRIACTYRRPRILRARSPPSADYVRSLVMRTGPLAQSQPVSCSLNARLPAPSAVESRPHLLLPH